MSGTGAILRAQSGDVTSVTIICVNVTTLSKYKICLIRYNTHNNKWNSWGSRTELRQRTELRLHYIRKYYHWGLLNAGEMNCYWFGESQSQRCI